MSEAIKSETYIAPITHGGQNHGWKLCKCSQCGTEQVCTPSFDFYVTVDDGPEGPLYCETCFSAWCRKRINP